MPDTVLMGKTETRYLKKIAFELIIEKKLSHFIERLDLTYFLASRHNIFLPPKFLNGDCIKIFIKY